MRHFNSFYEIVRNRVHVSVVVRQKVALTKRGDEYLGICPFHAEKTPSFTVNDKKKFYHCFGCHAHGDAIRFIVETTGMSYRDAAIKLAQEHGIDIPAFSVQQKELYDEVEAIYGVLELARNFFSSNLNEQAKVYLYDRKLSNQQIERYKIGYAPGKSLLLNFLESNKIPLALMLKAGLIGRKDDGRNYEIFKNRIIFPITNAYNKVIGFGGRVTGDSMPKYLNSPETILFKKSEALYGENIALSHIYKHSRVIVVEGYMDVIALHSKGLYEAVATLGTAFTEKHMKKLWQSCNEIILCFDGDAAGVRAITKVVEMVLPYISCSQVMSFVVLPNQLDPEQVVRQFGIQYFQHLLDSRLSLSEAIWYLETNNKKFYTAESLAQLEQKINKCVNKIKDRILTKNYQSYFRQQYWKLSNPNNRLQKSNPCPNLCVDVPTNKEYLEYLLILLLFTFPELRKDDIVIENFVNLEFCNSTAYNIHECLSSVNIDDTDSRTDLINSMRKMGVSESFLVMLQSPIMLSNTLLGKKHNPQLLWNLFYKKYQVIIIKEEYVKSLSNDYQVSFAKASLYQQEILKIEYEINLLNEFLSLDQEKYDESA